MRTSTLGFLSTSFVINSMSFASGISTLAAANANPDRFITFIKDVLMQQVFKSEEARLLVLDTLCILCQNLKSQVSDSESAKDNYEALVVHCRSKYL